VWGAYDHKTGISTRRVLGKARPDDHNTPAIIAPADRPPAVFYTGHNSTSVIRYRISRKVGDWEPGTERRLRMPGKVTYVQAHRGSTPDTLILLTRSGDDWMVALSRDYGASWVVRPFMRFAAGSYGYLISTQLDDRTIRVCVAGHPSQTNLTALYYTEIDASGTVRSAEGSTVANVYSGSGLPIAAPAALSTIHTFPAENHVRLFDVSAAPVPEVAFAEWTGDEEANYVYLTRGDSDWEPTVLVRSGRPIGYTYSTRYLGGVTFPNPTPGGELFLAREGREHWNVERWRREQDRWSPSVVTRSPTTLARPSAPVGASAQLPLLWLKIRRYEGYTKFQGSTQGLLPEGRPRGFRIGTAIAGDWDGDGHADPGTFRSGVWTLRVGGRSTVVRFGTTGDTPVVGDWDGDGKDGIGVRRGRTWVLSNTVAPASAFRRFSYGATGDAPLVGDWDGDGKDGIGVRRGFTWYLRNEARGGTPGMRFTFGRATDVPVVGDWDGDGTDGIGIKRGSMWMLRLRPGSGSPQVRFNLGRANDAPVVGDWGALGKDSPGVRRASTGVWYVVDSPPGVPRSNFAPNRFIF